MSNPTAATPEPAAAAPLLETPPPPPDRFEASIIALTDARGPSRSICPSEVARALYSGPLPDGWRSLLTPVRQAAMRLVQAGRIDILRKGRPVAADAVRGVIRLRTAHPALEGGTE